MSVWLFTTLLRGEDKRRRGGKEKIVKVFKARTGIQKQTLHLEFQIASIAQERDHQRHSKRRSSTSDARRRRESAAEILAIPAASKWMTQYSGRSKAKYLWPHDNDDQKVVFGNQFVDAAAVQHFTLVHELLSRKWDASLLCKPHFELFNRRSRMHVDSERASCERLHAHPHRASCERLHAHPRQPREMPIYIISALT